MTGDDEPVHAIGILVERAAFSQFVAVLVRHLAQQYQCNVVVCLIDGNNVRDKGLATLLMLERLVLRKGRDCWSELASLEDRREVSLEALAGCSFVIDLSATGMPALDVPTLQPLYDGHAGEIALASALFFEGAPQITIRRLQGAQAPAVVAQGHASLEGAVGIGGAMQAVWSRVLVLLDKIIEQSGTMGSGSLQTRLHTGASREALPLKAVFLRSANMIAHAAAHAAYRLCCHAPHWRIGWRLVDEGRDVWARRDLDGAPWAVLQSPHDRFYADPFPVRWQGQDVLFFEDLPYSSQKGIISYCVFDEKGQPGPRIPVLEEPWHLSYPFLIEDDGEIFMIPEASLSGEITLYRARRFPDRWERHAVLVSNVEAADATIVRHHNKLWMFAVVRQGLGGYSDTLAIWSADRLTGPWSAHEQNPVLVDDQFARPAGNMILRDGKLFRPVQDARDGYGTALNLMRIDRLDETGFEQVLETHLRAGSLAWPGRKLHTLNSNGYLEVIDGTSIQPKSRLISDFFEARDPLEHA
jgi:hypothetical protein